jgi:hypothetical protein
MKCHTTFLFTVDESSITKVPILQHALGRRTQLGIFLNQTKETQNTNKQQLWLLNKATKKISRIEYTTIHKDLLMYFPLYL